MAKVATLHLKSGQDPTRGSSMKNAPPPNDPFRPSGTAVGGMRRLKTFAQRTGAGRTDVAVCSGAEKKPFPEMAAMGGCVIGANCLPELAPHSLPALRVTTCRKVVARENAAQKQLLYVSERQQKGLEAVSRLVKYAQLYDRQFPREHSPRDISFYMQIPSNSAFLRSCGLIKWRTEGGGCYIKSVLNEICKWVLDKNRNYN